MMHWQSVPLLGSADRRREKLPAPANDKANEAQNARALLPTMLDPRVFRGIQAKYGALLESGTEKRMPAARRDNGIAAHAMSPLEAGLLGPVHALAAAPSKRESLVPA